MALLSPWQHALVVMAAPERCCTKRCQQPSAAVHSIAPKASQLAHFDLPHLDRNTLAAPIRHTLQTTSLHIGGTPAPHPAPRTPPRRCSHPGVPLRARHTTLVAACRGNRPFPHPSARVPEPPPPPRAPTSTAVTHWSSRMPARFAPPVATPYTERRAAVAAGRSEGAGGEGGGREGEGRDQGGEFRA